MDVCQFLVLKGADVNATSAMYVNQPYTKAFTHAHMKVVTFSPFWYSLRGSTPLHWSIERGHMDVCQFLVEKGADVNVADNK
jgi:hypothetical protein